MTYTEEAPATYHNDLFLAYLRASILYSAYLHRRPRFINNFWRRVTEVYPNIDHINMLCDLIMITFTPASFKAMRRREEVSKFAD
ncbi:hypothetical protein ES708_30758 [subsurface metagenome]